MYSDMQETEFVRVLVLTLSVLQNHSPAEEMAFFIPHGQLMNPDNGLHSTRGCLYSTCTIIVQVYNHDIHGINN